MSLMRSALAMSMALACLAPATAMGQERELPLRLHLAVGIAGAHVWRVDRGDAFGPTLQVAAQWDHHVVMARGLSFSDWTSFPDGSDDLASEVGLLYGRRRSLGWVQVFWAVGPSIAWRHEGVTGYQRAPWGFGLTGAGEANLSTTPAGIALQLFGSLNTVAPLAGLATVIEVGWLRR
jgi:hypothetical protein